MKNFLKPVGLVTLLLLLIPVALFAQTGIDSSGVNYDSAFATFVSLTAAIPVVVEFLKRLLGKTKATPNWLVQVFSWIVGIILALVGWVFHLGFLAGIDWYWAIIYGFGATLAANGVADTKIIQWIFSLFNKK